MRLAGIDRSVPILVLDRGPKVLSLLAAGSRPFAQLVAAPHHAFAACTRDRLNDSWDFAKVKSL
jgi:hypothetical protein